MGLAEIIEEVCSDKESQEELTKEARRRVEDLLKEVRQFYESLEKPYTHKESQEQEDCKQEESSKR